MGTSLTGLTPATTYDALIKVGDNGPLSATAKYLSDGLGNDSPLAMSTTAVGIGTTSPATYGADLAVQGSGNGIVSIGQATSYATLQSNGQDFYLNAKGTGNIIFRNGSSDTERMRITSAGNVGIGTTTPNQPLTIGATNGYPVIDFENSSTAYGDIGFQVDKMVISAYASTPLTMWTNGNERMRITNNGYLRLSSNSGGIQFNDDTSASNALDDYEEGTFTPSIAFGGASVGITYFDRAGVYTKIGRQVTCTIYVALINKGSSTGAAVLTGLPFANSNVNRGSQSAGSLRFDNVTYTGFPMISIPNSTSNIVFQEVTEAGVDTTLTNSDFTNDSEMSITVTYFTA